MLYNIFIGTCFAAFFQFWCQFWRTNQHQILAWQKFKKLRWSGKSCSYENFLTLGVIFFTIYLDRALMTLRLWIQKAEEGYRVTCQHLRFVCSPTKNVGQTERTRRGRKRKKKKEPSTRVYILHSIDILDKSAKADNHTFDQVMSQKALRFVVSFHVLL